MKLAAKARPSAAALIATVLIAAGFARAATFGRVVSLPGGASDITLDEKRNQLYLPQPLLNQVQVYSLARSTFATPIPTDTTPLSSALARDGSVLYVTCYDSSVLDIVDLTALSVTTRVKLPAQPEGIAVAADGRVLISTIGASGTNALVLYTPTTGAVTAVTVAPAAGTPPTLPPPSGRPFLADHSQLVATSDGRYIGGVNAPAGNPVAFVYESASGTVLRSRTIAGSSTSVTISPNGARLMAGVNLFDATTMQVLAQQNLQNATFPVAAGTAFNVTSTQGGGIFSQDGSTLYSVYDTAPVGGAPNTSLMILNDPDNLAIKMGIQLPENLAGKMVQSADGSNAYALSDSGFTVLPLSTVARSALASPANTAILLARDVCGVVPLQTVSVAVNNPGAGKITASAALYPANGASPANAASVRSVAGGATPQLSFTINSALSKALGTVLPPADYAITSAEAINVPDKIRVYENSRNTEAVGNILPIPVGNPTGEAFPDLLYDTARQRLFITNTSLNRIEVFDIKTQAFLAPIKVGQLPVSMAMTLDGGTIYVVNSGGESISIVDPAALQTTGTVAFPPIPFNSNLSISTPVQIVMSLNGPIFTMNNGTLWTIIGNVATPRRASRVIGTNTTGQTVLTSPNTMAATPGGEYVVLGASAAAGATNAYLYDASVDDWVTTRSLAGSPGGYFGPAVAGTKGQYYFVNGTFLNSALVAQRTQPGLLSGAAAVGATTLALFNAPTAVAATALPTTLPSIQVVDGVTGLPSLSLTPLEGPLVTTTAAARATVKGRNLAIDVAGGFAYAITATGLSIVPTASAPVTARPNIFNKGIVSLASYLPSTAPNGLISIFGTNLASNAVAGSTPLPTILGGACVTLNNSPIPLLMTSPGQINAQIPPGTAQTSQPVVVHSIPTASASASQNVSISKYAPAVLVDGQGNAALLHSDGTYVSKDNPANRDESLQLYVVGLGATTGGQAAAGQPSPSNPLAEVSSVRVFFGDPSYKQSEMIVDWAGLAPGLIGVYQIDITVPGFHSSGDALPITVEVNGVDSSVTGPAVPYAAVN